VAGAVKIPVIGIGGIATAEDAIEFLLAGATAIEVGTANFVNPRATEEILQGIHNYLECNNMKSVRELIGALII
jgi:dihydroorotate dehydrogenase (NAD+) catalytic subunit